MIRVSVLDMAVGDEVGLGGKEEAVLEVDSLLF